MTWMHSSRVGVRTSAWTSGTVGIDVLEDRQAEGRGLARAGLRLADDVAALEHRRDRLLLDRAGLLVSDVLQREQRALGEPQIGKGGHSAAGYEVQGHAVCPKTPPGPRKFPRGQAAVGSSSSLPVVRRACMSVCACAASASG